MSSDPTGPEPPGLRPPDAADWLDMHRYPDIDPDLAVAPDQLDRLRDALHSAPALPLSDELWHVILDGGPLPDEFTPGSATIEPLTAHPHLPGLASDASTGQNADHGTDHAAGVPSLLDHGTGHSLLDANLHSAGSPTHPDHHHEYPEHNGHETYYPHNHG